MRHKKLLAKILFILFLLFILFFLFNSSCGKKAALDLLPDDFWAKVDEQEEYLREMNLIDDGDEDEDIIYENTPSDHTSSDQEKNKDKLLAKLDPKVQDSYQKIREIKKLIKQKINTLCPLSANHTQKRSEIQKIRNDDSLKKEDKLKRIQAFLDQHRSTFEANRNQRKQCLFFTQKAKYSAILLYKERLKNSCLLPKTAGVPIKKRFYRGKKLGQGQHLKGRKLGQGQHPKRGHLKGRKLGQGQHYKKPDFTKKKARFMDKINSAGCQGLLGETLTF